MKPLRRPVLIFAAICLAVAGAVSARDTCGVSPTPQSMPEIVVGRGGVSGFSTKPLDAETGFI